MKKPFTRENPDRRAEYLRQKRANATRVPSQPPPLPQVMPPLKVTTLEESRRMGPRNSYNNLTGSSNSSRPSMMNLVYPPLKESDLRDTSRQTAVKHHRETPQPFAAVNKLAGKMIAARKAVKEQEQEEQPQATVTPDSIYINPRMVIPQPVKKKRSLRGMNLGWRLLSLVLAGILGYGIYFMWTSPFFKVESPAVTGNARVGSAEFISAMAVEGKPSFTIVPSEVYKTLLNTFPEVESANLDFTFPNKVSLEVKEREPVLIWKQGGQTLWIDLFGIPMMPRGQAGNWYLVTASGDAVGPVAVDPVNHPGQYKPIADPELILTILNLANMTPAGTSIAYDPRYGLGWVDPKGWKVYFGFNMVGLDSKLAQYAGIVTNLSNQGIQPKIISIQYPYAPFYRLEQ
jgi:hypothetical protein